MEVSRCLSGARSVKAKSRRRVAIAIRAALSERRAEARVHERRDSIALRVRSTGKSFKKHHSFRSVSRLSGHRARRESSRDFLAIAAWTFAGLGCAFGECKTQDAFSPLKSSRTEWKGMVRTEGNREISGLSIRLSGSLNQIRV